MNAKIRAAVTSWPCKPSRALRLVYHWIESYLTDRSQTVTIGNNSSAAGVPQGSVLGPLLSSIYTSPIASIASTSLFLSSNLLITHNFKFLLPHPISLVNSIVLKFVSLSCTPGAVITPFPSILINLTLFSLEPGQRSNSFSDVTTVNVAGSVVPMADHVRLPGVTLDNRLSMDKPVNEVSRTCIYHLRALWHIRPAKNINRLQRIQNALARCVLDP